MKIRPGEEEVAQTHGPECADIVWLLAHQEAADLAEVARDGEAIDILRAATLAEQRQRLARMRHELRAVRRYADIMKPVIGEHRTGRIPSVARHAAALAVEDRPAAFLLHRQRLVVAAHEAVER